MILKILLIQIRKNAQFKDKIKSSNFEKVGLFTKRNVLLDVVLRKFLFSDKRELLCIIITYMYIIILSSLYTSNLLSNYI